MKTDPYTGEEFAPKRSNQRFATRANQIAYNNAKARELRQQKAGVNNALESNRKVLKRILGEEESITVSKDFMLGAGFNFIFFSQSARVGGKSCQLVYDYVVLPQNDTMFTIQKKA